MTSERGTPTPAWWFDAHPPPAPTPSRREHYAGLVSRLLALAVDAALLALAVAAIGAGAPGVWGSMTGSVPRWLSVGAGVVAGLVPFAYFWLAWCTTGSTFGGTLLGTAVRRADGSRLGVIRAAARALIGLAFAPIWLICMPLIAFDPRRRALHDVLLRTVVRRTDLRFASEAARRRSHG